MPRITATAPGKMILFGEHAVVYGRPAIAAPVLQVCARVTISPEINAPPGRVWMEAGDIAIDSAIENLPEEHPLKLAVTGVKTALGLISLPALRITITSTIPIAGGLGSGAAVSTAVIRALSSFLGHPLENEAVNALVYRVEQKHHGTPSGIDNTVISYACPIIFQRERPFERLVLATPLTFVIADTGIKSPTALAVGEVRRQWLTEPERFEDIFDRIGTLVSQARNALTRGDIDRIGALMDRNHELLQQLGVSSPELDYLVHAARAAGAPGAKLSGGGRGGNMICLADADQAQHLAESLTSAGAVRTIITHLEAESTGKGTP